MKKMITLPPFDDNSYVWQSKGWKKINTYSDRNLGALDLTDKEYLGNGVYRLHNANGVILDYNIYNGIYKLNGLITASFDLWILTNFNLIGNHVLNVILIKTNGNFIFIGRDIENEVIYNGTDGVRLINSSFKDLRLFLTRDTQIDLEVKIQIEQGSQATPYKPPAAPVKYYLEHDYEPLTMEGFINYDNKIFNNFSQIIENKKRKKEK